MTKHGLSRERLEKLVKLHGCSYRGGRSEIAPLARTGKTDRITMANADKILRHVDKVSSSERLGQVHRDGSGTLRECSSNHGSGTKAPHFGGNGNGFSVMPHLDFTGRDLDEAYPSIVAPADDRLDDVAADEYDAVFQHGLQIAEEIRGQMQEHGRKRRFNEDKTTTTTTNTTAVDKRQPKDELNLSPIHI